MVLFNQDAITLSDYSKVKLSLEGHGKTFVEHRGAFILVSEKEHLGN